MDRLIECVPNFSEGRDMAIIRQITDAAESVDGVRLLDVDPGRATNRTVVTIAGEPQAVIEAAVRAGAKAAELIDMTKHSGEHPRFGAMDVCPLVPIRGVTMEETVAHAHELARRLGEEVGLTVYCYEHAAREEGRRNLAKVRAGEYEGLEEKLADPAWGPDFGPSVFNARAGATAVSARDFLVAYNVNLNTTSTRRANAIAFDVREKGRIKREGNPLTGEIVRDAQGDAVWLPGSLKCVKGIGWFIEEYGVAQISMNLTNISVTSAHAAFDECCERARARGVRVTGSELVGLIPLEAMLDAGRYYLTKQQRSLGVSDGELIKIAVKSMGLDELAPFDPDKKIIEYVLAAGGQRRLVDNTLEGFVHETASESVAPGGGSVAAALGALGAALGTMVANLSSHKRGWDERWSEFSDWAERGKACHGRLLALVDEDTAAFNRIMDAFGLPKGSAEEQAARAQAIQAATTGAIEVPLEVMAVALESMEVIAAMAQDGLAASASDAGVGALCARSAVLGAGLNVAINAKDLTDKEAAKDFCERARELEDKAREREARILDAVRAKL
ncbi:MAG: glutamate formimidoyltransferase [Planctomycetota bacterium]|jgi:glutamate formiminotransferase/formiminotetrahydrofolate cyclodeaminase|nr:glutamate formimidoyltransferase [Planctomycetota bacterium]MDP6518594.1 glutamate formimidoyltransferase [Planctomycetota bacterium]MDP6839126.1 glutamate formimidoyltransferase [Planctomycetota bacterium]MDP6954696.1 glutamate formimidoyltransferase [Planctomycetota bacterium]